MAGIQSPTPIVEAGRSGRHYWRDLWRYRELFYVLAWREIAVRYKQTVIGLAWALLRPLLTVPVFTVAFGRLAKLPSDGAPYGLMVFAGRPPWPFFAAAYRTCRPRWSSWNRRYATMSRAPASWMSQRCGRYFRKRDKENR